VAGQYPTDPRSAPEHPQAGRDHGKVEGASSGDTRSGTGVQGCASSGAGRASPRIGNEGPSETLTVNGHAMGLPGFWQALLAWGRENFRPFPWRLTNDPYRILMAEVMLHRTQARQVVRVYERFIARYPDINALGCATRADLHEILYSLGLQWRIDLIHTMTQALVQHHHGQIPRDKDALMSLPGVSEYVASAVRCFAWGFPEALIDTNTVRVAGRLFGLEVKDSSRRNRTFRELLASLVDQGDPRAFNYALLDLADEICTKRRAPQCDRCPLALWCRSACSGQAGQDTKPCHPV